MPNNYVWFLIASRQFSEIKGKPCLFPKKIVSAKLHFFSIIRIFQKFYIKRFIRFTNEQQLDTNKVIKPNETNISKAP